LLDEFIVISPTFRLVMKLDSLHLLVVFNFYLVSWGLVLDTFFIILKNEKLIFWFRLHLILIILKV